jgi:release factor glutamine methyltransferase
VTIYEASQQLLFQLFHLYDEREARNITDLVMEHVTGWTKIDRVMNKQVPLSQPKEELLKRMMTQLLDHMPVQYVLKEAWFAGMRFYVNEHVLIPRPETEELTDWVVKDLANDEKISVLDVGTGSGCIAVTLKKRLPHAEVFACDISAEAIVVAQMNAAAHLTDISFSACDFLNPEERNLLPDTDVIVSNPPYIPVNEKASMPKHVVQYEPHTALFVGDANPLLFYEAISAFARSKLKDGGAVYVEIHEDLEPGVKQLFRKFGFRRTDTSKDLQGKQRMIRAGELIK